MARMGEGYPSWPPLLWPETVDSIRDLRMRPRAPLWLAVVAAQHSTGAEDFRPAEPTLMPAPTAARESADAQVGELHHCSQALLFRARPRWNPVLPSPVYRRSFSSARVPDVICAREIMHLVDYPSDTCSEIGGRGFARVRLAGSRML
jgi:hypothetical protein